MKILILICIAILLTCSVYGQVIDLNLNTIYLNNHHRKVSTKDTYAFYYEKRCSMESGFKLKNNLPTGQYNVYNNDTLIYIAVYNENKKNGLWYYFYGDGDTNSIINYLDGLENGYYKRFYKGSKLMQLGYYKNGIMDGDWCFYSESGEKITVTTWENDFKVKSIGYYASGKIQSIENFFKGLFHGRCEYFFEDGSIDRVIYYNQDKVIDFKRYEKSNQN